MSNLGVSNCLSKLKIFGNIPFYEQEAGLTENRHKLESVVEISVNSYSDKSEKC